MKYIVVKELRAKEPEDYRNFLRMDETAFDELLSLVQPLIRKGLSCVHLHFLSVSLLEDIATSMLGNPAVNLNI